MKLTLQEIESRHKRFFEFMNRTSPEWETAIILDKVNQYYFTGTIQDGMLFFKKDGNFFYFVRRSFERAVIESPLKNIFQINSYRDIAEKTGSSLGVTFLETDVIPYGTVERLQKYFQIKSIGGVDNAVRTLRSVKSPYELGIMETAGSAHSRVLNEEVPSLLRDGINESEFTGKVLERMFSAGHHGMLRYHMFQTEFSAGQIGFSENSLFPTNFDGPGGSLGYSAAAPANGNPNTKLKKGDLVFVDIGFGFNGYHSDKTQVYMFGAEPTSEAKKLHQKCRDVEKRIAEKLVPGAVPSKIYNEIMSGLDNDFLKNFMGFKNRKVKFLGHGVGLNIDELPVLANGFDEPIEENMVLALEPKCGLEKVGMVGIEEMYVVTKNGGRCLTGGSKDILVVR